MKYPKKGKILKINKSKTKYYVLSEEANNMIKSYSKKKHKRENQLKKIESVESHNEKKINFKLKKYIILSNDDNFNNSYVSSTVNKKNFKNEKKENILKQSLDKTNQKYVVITVLAK